VEGARGETDHAGEQVREESLGVAQEGTLALDAAQLLEERERQDLGVRKPLEPFVAPGAGVEVRIGIVYEAEQDGESLFRLLKPSGMVSVGHLLLLMEGSLMAPFYSQTAQQTSSAELKRSATVRFVLPLRCAPSKHMAMNSQ
jgi:hypothetical protein